MLTLRKLACAMAAVWTTVLLCEPAAARADNLRLSDGQVLEGAVVRYRTLLGDPRLAESRSGEGGYFLMVDDGLKRIFVGTRRVARLEPDNSYLKMEHFRIPQPVRGRSGTVTNAANILKVDPFDEFGRRTITLRDAQGERQIVQGIVELTPRYARVSALRHFWESALSTKSIPRERVDRILRHHIDAADYEQRSKLATFYIQAEWYDQAREELSKMLDDFPAQADAIKSAMVSLRQLEAQQALGEIRLRKAAGQHALALKLLQGFPEESIATEILQEVRALLTEYQAADERIRQVKAALVELQENVPAGPMRAKLSMPIDEIRGSLNLENLARLEPFTTLSADTTLTAEDRLGLALLGWVAGPLEAQPKLDRALRLWEARGVVHDYLTSEQAVSRERMIGRLKSLEGVGTGGVARIIEHMMPIDPPSAQEGGGPFEFTVKGPGDEQGLIHYWVQLPPEYTPFHRYPVVLTLHGGGRSPATQIEFWAAQAGRHGYIVVAPEYAYGGSAAYQHTADEDAAVTRVLEDVRRRFQVDSDRVFLTGHAGGAQMAWDVGLAHPDLFAGVMPIIGGPEKYATRYWPNAQHLALYVVEGEKDGDRPERCRKLMEKILPAGYDCEYVEFIGRGQEGFYEEIQALFQWMNRKQRAGYPKELKFVSYRSTDNFFYWLRVEQFPVNQEVDPRFFEERKLPRPTPIEGRILKSNTIQATVGTRGATVYISPEMIDFEQPATVRINGRAYFRGTVEPSLAVLLEEVRAHGDRQRLYHAKVVCDRL